MAYGDKERYCSRCHAPITSHSRSGMCKPCVHKRNQENRERGVAKKWLSRGGVSINKSGCMITNNA